MGLARNTVKRALRVEGDDYEYRRARQPMPKLGPFKALLDKHRKNTELRADRIPSSAAQWSEIERFALTFDGYAVYGEPAALARVARETTGATLTELRAKLFFEQRFWKNEGTVPDEESLGRIRLLLEQIRFRVTLANELLA